MENTITVEQLVAAGGSLWEKGDLRRVYFNDLWQYMGVKVETYKTGNIVRAWIDGELVSNSAAKSWIEKYAFSKLYFDLATGEWQSEKLGSKSRAQIIAEINRRMGVEA